MILPLYPHSKPPSYYFFRLINCFCHFLSSLITLLIQCEILSVDSNHINWSSCLILFFLRQSIMIIIWKQSSGIKTTCQYIRNNYCYHHTRKNNIFFLLSMYIHQWLSLKNYFIHKKRNLIMLIRVKERKTHL